MKKYLISMILLAVVIAMIAGGWYVNHKTVLSSNTLKPLAIALAMQPGSGLVMVALEKGFFKEEGLAVKVKSYPSGKRAVEDGLFGSKLDIATTADTPVAFAAFERSGYKVIATLCEADNIYHIVAKKKVGIVKAEDLRSKRISTQSKSASHFFLSLFLLKHGIRMSDVNLTYLKSEILPKVLAEGRVDAVSIREPYLSQAQKMLGKDAVVYSAPGLYTQLEIAVASDTLILEHPDMVEKFVRAILRAEGYIKEHPQESMKLIAAYLNTPYTEFQHSAGQNQYRVSLSQSLIESLDDQGRWAINEKLVKADEIPDYGKFIDDRWLRKLKPESVTMIQ